MRELWIGRVEVMTPPTAWGDCKAFTNVVTWATGLEDFSRYVGEVFEKYGWSLIGIEECVPASRVPFPEGELADALERAKLLPDACIYLTFHYYPSKSV